MAGLVLRFGVSGSRSAGDLLAAGPHPVWAEFHVVMNAVPAVHPFEAAVVAAVACAIVAGAIAITWVINAHTEVGMAARAKTEAKAEAGISLSGCREANGQNGSGG